VSNFRNLIGEIPFLAPKKKLSNFLALSWYIYLSTVSCVFRILRSDLRRSCFAMQSSSVYHSVLGRKINCFVCDGACFSKTFGSSELYVFTKSSVVPTWFWSADRFYKSLLHSQIWMSWYLRHVTVVRCLGSLSILRFERIAIWSLTRSPLSLQRIG
jgi:hypothetical protein